MRTITRIALATLIILLSACNFPGVFPVPVPTGALAFQPALIVAPANATPTATPFQPLPPTPTYLPTVPAGPVTEVPPTPTFTPSPEPIQWGVFPGPSAPSDYPIPPPVPRFPVPEGQVSILLLGSDQRPNDGGFRTDTIVLLTLNTVRETASLISFPRDLYVYIPGWTMQRINTAQPRGGFETSAMTFEYNFGVRPDYYVMINFWSFMEVIDSLGGIDVQVGAPLTDARTGHGQYHVPAGTVRMDGETALWYVRSRGSSSDFERTRRQQEVVKAVFARLLSLNAVARAPELYNIYRKNVTTNMELKDIVPLLPLAAKMSDTSRIKQYYIGRSQVTGYVTSIGAQVLLPNREAVLEVMRQALGIP